MIKRGFIYLNLFLCALTAFAQLPEDYREVITLSRVVGLSHGQIASQLGKSEGAVRVLLHRALARLSGLLGT